MAGLVTLLKILVGHVLSDLVFYPLQYRFSALCLALILLTQYVVPNIELQGPSRFPCVVRQKMLYFVANNYYILI